MQNKLTECLTIDPDAMYRIRSLLCGRTARIPLSEAGVLPSIIGPFLRASSCGWRTGLTPRPRRRETAAAPGLNSCRSVLSREHILSALAFSLERQSRKIMEPTP
jgi:hypothetical protein